MRHHRLSSIIVVGWCGMEDEKFQEVMRRHGVRLLLQHGSTVTGTTHPGSDLDLAVDLDPPPASLLELGGVIADLQSLFPGREIDLVEIRKADPLLLRKISECCRLLHGSMTRFHEFQILAFKRYQDHRRFFQMEKEYVDALCARARR